MKLLVAENIDVYGTKVQINSTMTKQESFSKHQRMNVIHLEICGQLPVKTLRQTYEEVWEDDALFMQSEVGLKK